MKVCLTCGIEKALSAFPHNIRSNDRVADICKLCKPNGKGRPKGVTNSGIKRDKLPRGRPRTKLKRDEKKAIISLYRHPCIICNESDQSCLHFHHLRDKKFGICTTQITVNKQQLLEEISKCVVLCSNCHMKYHRGNRFCFLTDKPN